MSEPRSGDPLFAVDREARIVLWNDALAKLTGIGADAAAGRRCYEVLEGTTPGGEPLCGPNCPVLLRARSGQPVVEFPLVVRTAAGRRAMRVSTISVGKEPGALVLHLLRPVPAAQHDEGAAPSGEAEEPAILTRRQRQILALLAQGVRAAGVATELGLSEVTVRNHIRALLARLGCHSQLEAVAEARRRGIV